ncbi:hypothetical protein KIN20_018822 [Parelaphostrongylus tenuis]|uniref:Uncharacterized protein n=1 Tax=Parelaphostrongylus tenuis TaxID=148309 RepID=A0AAD5QSH2_PARTN|nr:hypothetical protein KIN20_018822 [Parelaphostrongylus tenuis]
MLENEWWCKCALVGSGSTRPGTDLTNQSDFPANGSENPDNFSRAVKEFRRHRFQGGIAETSAYDSNAFYTNSTSTTTAGRLKELRLSSTLFLSVFVREESTHEKHVTKRSKCVHNEREEEEIAELATKSDQF